MIKVKDIIKMLEKYDGDSPFWIGDKNTGIHHLAVSIEQELPTENSDENIPPDVNLYINTDEE